MAMDTWQDECRPAARRAMKEVLETRIHNTIDAHLEQMRVAGLADCRNGSLPCDLLGDVGDLGLRIPRPRAFGACAHLKCFARRAVSIERMILMAFLLGLFTQEVGPALCPSWRADQSLDSKSQYGVLSYDISDLRISFIKGY